MYPRLGLAVSSRPEACGICIVTPVSSPRSPVVCSRKRRLEEDERQSIPNVLQGEVARLDPKFLVNLDPSHCSNNGTVHLICKLGEWPGWSGCLAFPLEADLRGLGVTLARVACLHCCCCSLTSPSRPSSSSSPSPLIRLSPQK